MHIFAPNFKRILSKCKYFWCPFEPRKVSFHDDPLLHDFYSEHLDDDAYQSNCPSLKDPRFVPKKEKGKNSISIFNQLNLTTINEMINKVNAVNTY